MAGPTVTALSRLAIGTTTPTTNILESGELNHGVSSEFADANRNRGSLNRRSSRTRLNRTNVAPSFIFEPTVGELALLLPWIMGQAGTGSGTLTYDLANAAAERDFQWDDGQGNCDTFGDVAVVSAQFATQSDGLLQLSVQGRGKTHSTADAFPTLTNLDVLTSPFVLPDTTGAVLVNAAAIACQDIVIGIEHAIDPRFLNSLTHTKNVKNDRTFSVQFMYPDGDYQGLWASAETPSAVSITFVNGGYSLAFQFAEVRFPKQPKRAPVRGEMMNVLTGMAYETDAAPPLRIVLDTVA